MPAQTIKIAAHEGGQFDCYLALPDATPDPVPAIVLASAVHGVDEDLRALADHFATQGYIAAAPDLFWRWLPGPPTCRQAHCRGLAGTAHRMSRPPGRRR